MSVSASITYQNICANSHLLFEILAIVALARFATFSAILEALAIFLETATFDAVAASARPLVKGPTAMNSSVLAAEAPASFATGLPCPVALAIFGLAVGFDATAANASLG